MINAKLLIIRCVLFPLIVSTSGGTLVQTNLGKLEGSIEVSRNGRNYYSFKGIRYGQTSERFEVAREVQPWEDVRKALEFGNSCPHFDPMSKSVIGDDDCLYLNVYSPQVTGESNLPVMVWFHPGAFEMGKSDDYDPKYFMDEDVVLVTLNYRLGALGFLSTEDDVAPGNLGLKDQNLALRWVKTNIQKFGGNSDKVTIFGESAGGASVHNHILSPASSGLFRNAISQSGTAVSPWAFQYNPKSNAKKFASFLKCPTADSQQIVECVKSKSLSEIIEAQSKLRTWSIYPFNTFAPSVEPKGSPNPFLTECPHAILESGKFNRVPWIVGVTEDEGVLLSPIIIMNSQLINETNEEWNKVAPHFLLYNYETEEERRDEISDKTYTHYFGSDPVDEETWDSLTDAISDRYFVHPMDICARLHAKFAPVYPYIFTFPGGYSPALHKLFGITADMGVAHTDELPYLFHGFWGSPGYTDETRQETFEISKNFVKLWTSFSTNSAPTAVWGGITEWKSVPKNLKANKPIKYYEIATKMTLSDLELQERVQFWNDLALPNCTKSSNTVTKDEL